MKRRVQDFCRLFHPINYAGYELLIMRALFALVVWDLAPGGMSLGAQPVPVGLAKWPGIDFTFFSDPAVYGPIKVALGVSLLAYAAGVMLPAALAVMLFVTVGTGTLNNSQGAATHSAQLVTMCILTQFAWHFYATWRRFFTKQRPQSLWQRQVAEGRAAVWFTQQCIAAAYVVSAFSKWLAKGDWLRDSAYFPLQIVKSQRMDYFNDLQPHDVTGGDRYGVFSELLRPVARWMETTMMESPEIGRLLLSPGFFLELFAIVLLAGRVVGGLFALFLILFHLTVAEIMGIDFKYHVYLLAIFFLSAPYWITRAGETVLSAPARKDVAVAAGDPA